MKYEMINVLDVMMETNDETPLDLKQVLEHAAANDKDFESKIKSIMGEMCASGSHYGNFS